jgi:hypothetical protein
MNESKVFKKLARDVESIIEQWFLKLLMLPTATISERKNQQDRSIKQILGHLIDSASNNHQRIVRLQYKRDLVFPDYRQDNDTWIAIQNYQNENWENLVNLWKYYNLHLIYIFQNVDEECLDHTWTDFEGNLVSLEKMIDDYLEHLQLHIKEIEELLPENF